MPAQSIDNQILHYLPLLEQDQKKSILSVIKSFIKSKEEVAVRISLEQYNAEIDAAEQQMEAGEFYSLDKVKELAKKW